ncbi:ABC transporter substrate-binding protein [Micromonospora sp. NBC_01813]|uniref:ABC transporter substrate-binding protein n=1 Tax=Micromonospora sp. NBC_01813 TaxID=2975988 RepID=UPI002DD7AFAD|nr:ABC transporter substrate-binding protein [Micromonospora sp. NBC_01813]WSA07021.1 ABC transporter substrate-binding protein [Micromonospora sp. NBC_01813]
MAYTISRRRLLLGSAGAVALAGVAPMSACGGGDAPPGESSREKVSVLTGAGFQGREAPIFVAQAQGWFAEEGLEVEVLQGKGSTENLKLLAAGQVDFATIDVNAGLIEYTRPGGIRDFVLTSVLHQRNLACFVAVTSRGVTVPSDLAGRRLSFLPGGINKLLFSTYAQLAGFDAGSVSWVANPVPAQHVPLLAARQVDAISQFVPAVDLVRKTVGEEVTVLPFTDYLTDLHGSAIGVATATAAGRPDLVRRFNRALLRGLRFAIDDPDTAGTIYAGRPETQGQQAQEATAELTRMAGYVTPVGDAPVGHFDPRRVARNVAILQGAGALGEAGLSQSDVDTVFAYDLVG